MYSRRDVITRLVYAYEQLQALGPIGDLTLTFDADAYDPKDLNKKWHSFHTNVLSKHFSNGLRVVTRSRVGRLHIHCAVNLNCDLTGFDWSSFNQANRYYTLYRQTKNKSFLTWYKRFTKIYRASMPEEFRKLHELVRVKAKTHGFGRALLLPVRKNNDALKWYLVGNIPHERQKRDKGLHFFASWNLKRAGKFKHITSKHRAYRGRLARFATGLGLNSENYGGCLRSVLGANWHWQVKDMIRNIDDLGSLQTQYNELKRSIRTHLLRTDQL